MIKIYKYGEVANDEIFARGESNIDVSGVVSDIIADVAENGDAALYAYCRKFDGAELSSLEVTAEEIEEAFAAAVQDGFDIEELAEQVMIEHYSEIEEAIKAAIADLLGILPF